MPYRVSLSRLLVAVILLLLALPLAAVEPTVDRGTELREAAQRGDVEAVGRLLEQGVEVDAANDYGATALSYAAGKGHLDVVRLLIEKGANPNTVDTFYNSSVLSWAVFNGQGEAVAYLLAHGATGLEEALTAAVYREDLATTQAIVGQAEVPAELLGKALAMAHRAEAAEIVAFLEQKGAVVPEVKGIELPPELLASYAGSYVRVGRDFESALSVVEGRLTLHIEGDTFGLDASDPVTFAPPEGTFTLHMTVEDEKATGFSLESPGRAEPMVFARPPGRSEGERVAEAGPAAEPAAETGAKPDLTPVAIPTGVAIRDWPAFRGPNAAGTAQGQPPASWDAANGEHVLWKTAIPGRAHSSPIVWGDRLFVTTAVASDAEAPFRNGLYGDVDAAGNKDKRFSWKVFALDKKTGAILWERTAHEGTPRSDNHIKATQNNATPATDGRHLVVMLGSEGLYCYSVDGELLWKRDLGALDVGWFYDSSYQWGHASSPILYEDKVIVQVDRHGDPFLAAYALADGREVWKTARENLPSWGTPTLLPAGDGFELVTNGSHFIRGYDPKTGAELWRLGPNSEVTVGTPVVGHGMVFVTGGYPPVRPIYAVRPGARGDLSAAEGVKAAGHVAWALDNGGTYMPTPLVYGDHLYTLANNGVLTAYDAKTGEQVYRERAAGKGGVAFTASPVAAAGRLYLASEDGDVYVIQAGPSFERLATNPLGEITMATPAISGDVLFVRTMEHVFAIGEKVEEAEGP